MSKEQKRHELKTWPEYFGAVKRGNKSFEIRVNDRDFKVGDTLVLNEYDPHTASYSGDSIECIVTYIAQGVFGLPDDVCVMAITRPAPPVGDDLVEARNVKTAWKKSIFATDKFTVDLRRKNTVRDIYTVGYHDGHDDGYAEARDFYYPKLQHAADKAASFARSVSPAFENGYDAGYAAHAAIQKALEVRTDTRGAAGADGGDGEGENMIRRWWSSLKCSLDFHEWSGLHPNDRTASDSRESDVEWINRRIL